LFVSAVTFFKK